MKLKYYLRGLGIGIICTAIIMGIAFSGNKKETLTDAEIIERARLLGMVMGEDTEEPSEENSPSAQDAADKQEEQKKQTEDKNTEKTKAEDKSSEDSKASEDKSSQDIKASEDKSSEDSKASEDKSSEDSKISEDKTSEDETADGNASQPGGTDKAAETEQTEPEEMVTVEIVTGDYSDVISQKLFQAGLITDADAFNKYLTQKGVDSSLRVGVHQIPKGATPDEIIEILQKKP